MPNGYVPGEVLEAVKGRDVEAFMRTQLAATQAGAMAGQAITQAAGLAERREEFVAEQARLESTAVMQALLGLYGIETEKGWRSLEASQRQQFIDVLSWTKQGAAESMTIGNLNMGEGANELGQTKIMEAKRFLNSVAPDTQVGTDARGNPVYASDMSEEIIRELENMRVSTEGKGEAWVLIKRNKLKGGWQFEPTEVKSYTRVNAMNVTGQDILKNAQVKLNAYAVKGWFGREKVGEIAGEINLKRQDAADIANFQELLEEIAIQLPMYTADPERKDRLTQEMAIIADAWMGGLANKNHPLVQEFLGECLANGVGIGDVAFLTPDQKASVDMLRSYRDNQYMLYTRMPGIDRVNKYSQIGAVSNSMPSQQAVVEDVNMKQVIKEEMQNIDWFKPIAILDTFDDTKIEAELMSGKIIKDIFPRLANRMVSEKYAEDIKLYKELQSMIAEIMTYDTPKYRNETEMHNISVNLLNYLNNKIASSDDDAFYKGLLAPSEALTLYQALRNEYGIEFTNSEEQEFMYRVGIERR